MKSRLIVLFVVFGFFCSCEKEKDSEKLDTYLIIGEDDAIITSLDTLITPTNRCDSLVYELDIDLDGLNDFGFNVYYCYGPGNFVSNFRFDCLNKKAKVFSNDSILSPQILNGGDTLEFNKNWQSENMKMLSASGTSELAGGDGVVYKNGNWYNISNEYIGILIENEGNPLYGWIKLSIPNDDWIKSLTIHEIGYKKAAYKLANK